MSHKPGIRFKLLRLIALTLLPAQALADISCLEGVSGKVLRWNSEWQVDRLDQGVTYGILNVTHFRSAESHSVQLMLAASGTADKRERTLVIHDHKTADAVCSNLSADAAPLPVAPLPAATRAENPLSESPAGSAEERFIRYSKIGWIRDDRPPRKQLATCRVLNQNFQCLEEEKQRYGQYLKDIEDEQRFGINR